MEMNTVNPALYSEAENEFLLAHLGESPRIALRTASPGVNPKAVSPLLEKVVELEELQERGEQQWLGIDGLREGIVTYLSQYRKWTADRRRGAPRFPSLYGYTPKGRPVWAAPGADAGIVQSYFSSDGSRKSFVITLVPEEQPEWNPDWAKADEPSPESGLVVNHDAHRVECFCGHTESFREDSRSSYNIARARMSKHLRQATEDVDKHREVYALEYAS
jgi:hypothetical protein